MTALMAMAYSFLFGLLHGILPDEHTWPITFSYAIGGASGKEGMKAGLYFSSAFTLQRMLVSELAYLALGKFLLLPMVEGIVYIIVGIAMSAAGAVVVRRNRYLHFHFIGHHHKEGMLTENSGSVVTRHHAQTDGPVMAPPARWALLHGFIAGFGFGGFALFIMTVAAPKMPGPWLGFLPGLLFGLGTMIMLVLIGALFGASLRWTKALTEQEVRRVGAQTGGRTLFFGGLLFGAAGFADLGGLGRFVPFDMGYLVIGLFTVTVVIPAFVYSWKEVLRIRNLPADETGLNAKTPH
jgi:hypothetical protein